VCLVVDARACCWVVCARLFVVETSILASPSSLLPVVVVAIYLLLWLVAVAGCCGWLLWLVAVAGRCGWSLWLVAVAGRCGWSLWLVSVAGCCCL